MNFCDLLCNTYFNIKQKQYIFLPLIQYTFSARLRKILSDTINDLETTRDYQSLKILIDTEIRLEKEEFNLIEENLKSESMFTYLENRFDDDTKKMKAKVKNIDDYISEIESELNVGYLKHFLPVFKNFLFSKDLKVENKIKLKLVNKWEETRYSQVKFITDSKEKQLEIMTENYKKDSTRELRLKHEIESIINILILLCTYLCYCKLKYLQHFLPTEQNILKI